MCDEITIDFNDSCRIEAIKFLCRRIEHIDLDKLSKLMYLSNKLHLIYYARPIYSDDYIGSVTGIQCKSIIELKHFGRAGLRYVLFDDYIENTLYGHYSDNSDNIALSESDMEIIDIVCDCFINHTTHDIIDICKNYPEYASSLNDNYILSDIDLISTYAGDKLPVTQNDVENSKEYYSSWF